VGTHVVTVGRCTQQSEMTNTDTVDAIGTAIQVKGGLAGLNCAPDGQHARSCRGRALLREQLTGWV
jgi:hypothetical protein